MFNVSQLYSIPQFLRANFQEVNYNERAYFTIKEKKKDLCDSSITFPAGYYGENKNIFQRKVDQCLVFALMRQKIWSFRLNIVKEKLSETLGKNRLFSLQYYIENFIFTSSYRIRKFHIYAKIHTCGKMLLSYIFVWRKAKKMRYFRETETYEN